MYLDIFKKETALIGKLGEEKAHTAWVMARYLEEPDVEALAAVGLTDGSNDKKIDFKAVATGGLPADALAQAQAAAVTPAAATAHDHEHAAEGALRAFFNQDDAATIEAFAERLMPGAPGKAPHSTTSIFNGSHRQRFGAPGR